MGLGDLQIDWLYEAIDTFWGGYVIGFWVAMICIWFSYRFNKAGKE